MTMFPRRLLSVWLPLLVALLLFVFVFVLPLLNLQAPSPSDPYEDGAIYPGIAFDLSTSYGCATHLKDSRFLLTRECRIVAIKQLDGSIDRIARVNATEGWQRLMRRASYGSPRCRRSVDLQQGRYKVDITAVTALGRIHLNSSLHLYLPKKKQRWCTC